MPFYKINAGHAAVDNGSNAPLSALFALASVAGQEVITGETYGDDYLRVPENDEERLIVEELMTERKLIWSVVERLPSHLSWKE